ncbi:hypothetical protein GJ496_000673 [Pomphorhynchus laevis]|nr:hypothetical protein GJ496_000673 [Pomphorhynchus laevis]
MAMGNKMCSSACHNSIKDSEPCLSVCCGSKAKAGNKHSMKMAKIHHQVNPPIETVKKSILRKRETVKLHIPTIEVLQELMISHQSNDSPQYNSLNNQNTTHIVTLSESKVNKHQQQFDYPQKNDYRLTTIDCPISLELNAGRLFRERPSDEKCRQSKEAQCAHALFEKKHQIDDSETHAATDLNMFFAILFLIILSSFLISIKDKIQAYFNIISIRILAFIFTGVFSLINIF